MKCAQCGNITVHNPCSFCGAAFETGPGAVPSGAPQLHFEAGLKPMYTEPYRAQPYLGKHSPIITVACTVSLVLAILGPILSAWATIAGLKQFVAGHIAGLGDAAMVYLSDLSLDLDSALSLSDTFSILKESAGASGNGALWLVMGWVVFLLSAILFLIALITHRRSMSIGRGTLVGGCILALAGGIVGMVGASKLFAVIPIPAPYAYAGYILLGCVACMAILAVLGAVKLTGQIRQSVMPVYR